MPLLLLILYENPISIFNNACPAVIFANNRILKLSGRASNDTFSMILKNGDIHKSIFAGKNKLNIFQPHLYIPTNINPINIPNDTINAQ